MEIQKELKYKVFKLIDAIITVQEFEEWLYIQDTLVNDLDNELHLTLFSFDYHHRIFEYDFRKRMFEFYDYDEFILWKVKLNLESIINKDDTVVRDCILLDFEDLAIDKFDVLSVFNIHLYHFEYDLLTEYSEDQLDEIIVNKAQKLLSRIILGEFKDSDFKLSDLESFEGNELAIESGEGVLNTKALSSYDDCMIDQNRNKKDIRNRWVAMGVTTLVFVALFLIAV